jgi:hypothetical protein
LYPEEAPEEFAAPTLFPDSGGGVSFCTLPRGKNFSHLWSFAGVEAAAELVAIRRIYVENIGEWWVP